MIGKIDISGQIGSFDGVTGVELVDVISQVKAQSEATEFNVYINSEGGLVDVGFDIYSYLKSLNKPITTIGRGLVASVATVIFMAGDKRVISENTPFMIHLPWGVVEGNAEEIENFTRQLKDIEKTFIDFYKKNLDLTEEAVRPLLKNETWLTKEQLTSLGFVTSEPMQIAAKAVIKSKKDYKMSNESKFSDEQKSWMENLFNSVLAKFKQPKVTNKLVQDANGAEIDFNELEDSDTVQVGAKATVDGAPAEGEYILPDGRTFVFTSGELTEIVEPEMDSAAMQAKIDELEEKLNASEQEKNTIREEAETYKNQLSTMETEVKDLKTKIMSKYNGTEKKNPAKAAKSNGKPEDRAAGIKEILKEKKSR